VQWLLPNANVYPEWYASRQCEEYSEANLQRVCHECNHDLQPYQEEMGNKYAEYSKANEHVGKGGIHVPFSDSLDKECRNAADILGNFFRPEYGVQYDRHIPLSFLKGAQGIAIMTIVKGGFGLTATAGTGIIISKLPDGSWSAPSAIGTAGLGGGLQIGGQIQELMVILGSQEAVRMFYEPQVNVGGSLDISAGPYGRSVEANAAANGSGLNGNYSYSLSKGLFAGAGIKGSVITTRKDLNQKFYGRALTPVQILGGDVAKPVAAGCLYDALHDIANGVEIHNSIATTQPIVQQQPSQVNQVQTIGQYQGSSQQAVTSQPPAVQNPQLNGQPAAQPVAEPEVGQCTTCGCNKYQKNKAQFWSKKCKSCKHDHKP